MKKLLAFCLSVFLFSCQQTVKSDTDSIENKIVYFRDTRTGLCFGAINSISYASYAVTSITCVPCDSLKHLEGF